MWEAAGGAGRGSRAGYGGGCADYERGGKE
jgi:hypothetical protein